MGYYDKDKKEDKPHYYQWGHKIYYDHNENVKQAQREYEREREEATREREERIANGGW